MARKHRVGTDPTRAHSIRFTAEEWARVVARAAAAGIPPSEWIRARALEER